MNNLICEDCALHCRFKDEETKAKVYAKCKTTPRVRRIHLNDAISIDIQIKGKVTNKDYPKDNHPKREFSYGVDLHKTENKLVYKDREIDRERNRYRELVVDSDTGEVIHECNHPLSEHKGHGSDKFNKNVSGT